MISALDSDTVSYLIKSDREVEKKFENMVENGDYYNIPPLVYYEVKRWLFLKQANVQLQAFTELYKDSIKRNMTIEIWEKAIKIDNWKI